MKSRHHMHPPRWADRFLQWYCNPGLLEEIQGDLHELFYRDCSQSFRWPKVLFVWNVMRFFRWRNIRKDRLKKLSPVQQDMFKSYFTSGIRNIGRNASTSILNITGLAIALGCAVVVFILEDSYYNLDAMHSKRDRIALVVNHLKEGEGTKRSALSAYPLGEHLAGNASVEKVVRAARGVAAVRVNDMVFNESILFAEETFLQVFDFDMAAGNRQSLSSKTQVMISETMAQKYFGTTEAVGREISFKFNDAFKREFTIGGVFADTPANSSMYFDFLVPMGVWKDMNSTVVDDWTKAATVTFALLREGADTRSLQSTFSEYRKMHNKPNTSRELERVETIAMTNVATESYLIAGSLSWSNLPAGMIGIAVMGTLLTLLACFNYMNVAVASVSLRLKEIGIRKVIGSKKSEIVQQFLFENVLVCLLALAAGTLLAYFFLVPAFDSLFPIKIAFQVSSLKNAIFFFGGILLFVAVVSGLYPALYVSSFKPVAILRGKEKFGTKSLFSKILLTLQFTLSLITMIGCLVFVWTSMYFENKDWGYNRAESMVVRLQDPGQFEALRTSLIANKKVVSHAGAADHISRANQRTTVRHNEKTYSATVFNVGFDYLESMNIRLVSGRFLDEKIESDKRESVVVNQAFVKNLGWERALEQSFTLDSTKYFVVGVVEDFYYDNFYVQVEPAIFRITPKENFRFLVVKAEAGAVNATFEQLKASWKKVAPDDAFDGFLQSTAFDNFITNLNANNKVTLFVSAITVFLAAMGLYGLVSYNLTRRLREFSVRKVFGASVFQIFRLMNGDYLWILVIAFGLGAPVAAYMMNMMIDAIYPDPVPTSVMPYVISISVMLIAVAATISTQLMRIVRENPTETLRIE